MKNKKLVSVVIGVIWLVFVAVCGVAGGCLLGEGLYNILEDKKENHNYMVKLWKEDENWMTRVYREDENGVKHCLAEYVTDPETREIIECKYYESDF